jgi:2-methylisocitrate lyase-like PEP mutase family enzyme
VTPALAAKDFRDLGFSMILYPATAIFRAAWATEQALAALKAGKPLAPNASFDLDGFEEVLELQKWAEIEKRFAPDRQAG